MGGIRSEMKQYTLPETNRKMQQGYQLDAKSEFVQACNIWEEVWKDVREFMDDHPELQNIEQFDNQVSLDQNLFNWSSDYELALLNAMQGDPRYAENLIKFCSEYIQYSTGNNSTGNKDQEIYTGEDTNLKMLQSSAASAYYDLGKASEGEQLFLRLINKDPEFVWYRIHYADAYDEIKSTREDNEKAVRILEDALQIKNCEDMDAVEERLDRLYKKLGMEEKLKSLRNGIQQKAGADRFKNMKAPATLTAPAATTYKVGRNDPCPCGSGKKYKNCCLKKSIIGGNTDE